MTFSENLAIKGVATGDDQLKFALATKSARFLFNQEIQDYCDKMRKKAVALNMEKWSIDEKASQMTEEQRRQSIEAYGNRMEWFTGQRDEIQKRFAPFLQIVG